MSILKANSTLTVLVYCVAEDDPPGPGKHTWKAVAVPVERASEKQIKLKKPLPGHGGTVFPPDAYGRLFFETPLQAIQHFLAARRLEIEALERRRAEAERALAWARSQEGMIP
jgi:hypothetical protein